MPLLAGWRRTAQKIQNAKTAKKGQIMSNRPAYGPNQLTPSSLCFGTMQFGAGADEADSAAMYHACREAGINFFDTAFVYNQGRSEEILGQLITAHRDELIIVTKAGAVGSSSPDNLRSQLETSLTRLKQDFTDIFFLHMFDADTPLEDSFAALAQLKQEGKFYHLGVSNFAAWQIMKAQAIARQHGYPEIEILQPMYNLVKRQAEVEILPMAEAEQIGVISYSPLGGGLLTGKYGASARDDNARGRLDWDEKYKTRYGQNWMHDAANGLMQMANEAGVEPATLAVAWVAQHNAITSPIISARNEAQLRPSLAAASFEMSNEIYDQLSGLSPRPAPATDRLEEQG